MPYNSAGAYRTNDDENYDEFDDEGEEDSEDEYDDEEDDATGHECLIDE